MAETHMQRLQYSPDRSRVTIWIPRAEGEMTLDVPKEAYVVADLLALRVMSAVSSRGGYSQSTILLEVLRTFIDHDVLACGDGATMTDEPPVTDDPGGEA